MIKRRSIFAVGVCEAVDCGWPLAASLVGAYQAKESALKLVLPVKLKTKSNLISFRQANWQICYISSENRGWSRGGGLIME